MSAKMIPNIIILFRVVLVIPVLYAIVFGWRSAFLSCMPFIAKYAATCTVWPSFYCQFVEFIALCLSMEPQGLVSD